MPQHAQTRDPSSGPKCPSGCSRLTGSAAAKDRVPWVHLPGGVTSCSQPSAASAAGSGRPKASGAHRVPRPLAASTTLSARVCLYPHGCVALYLSVCLPEPGSLTRTPRRSRSSSSCPRPAPGPGTAAPRDSAVPVSRPALPGSGGAWNDPAHSCGASASAGGEPGEQGCLRAGEKPRSRRWLTLSPAPPWLRPTPPLRPRRASCL